MKCNICNEINDEDALFCKRCGNSLTENSIERFNDNKKEKPKKIIKKETKKEVKVIKQKPKKEKNKDKKNKNNKEKVIIERRSSFGTRFLIFIMVIIIGVLSLGLGVVGYYEYEHYYNIVVPDLSGMTYNEAEVELAKNDLRISKKEKVTQNTEEVDRVIKQNKKAGSRAKKNAVITVTIGLKDESITVDNYVGLDIDSTISKLESKGIKYIIKYESNENKDYGVVLNQSIKPGKKISKDKEIIIIVNKHQKIESEEIESKEIESEIESEEKEA